MILDTPETSVFLKTDEFGQRLKWQLSWTEKSGKSLKMCVSPSFYFYSLIKDILPLRLNMNMHENYDDVIDWMVKQEFETEIEDADPEGYYCVFKKEDVQLNLEEFQKKALKPLSHVVQKEYTGTLFIELSRAQFECTVKIDFTSLFIGPIAPDNYIQHSHECDIMSMNHLTFQDA